MSETNWGNAPAQVTSALKAQLFVGNRGLLRDPANLAPPTQICISAVLDIKFPEPEFIVVYAHRRVDESRWKKSVVSIERFAHWDAGALLEWSA